MYDDMVYCFCKFCFIQMLRKANMYVCDVLYITEKLSSR